MWLLYKLPYLLFQNVVCAVFKVIASRHGVKPILSLTVTAQRILWGFSSVVISRQITESRMFDSFMCRLGDTKCIFHNGPTILTR